MGAVLSIEQSAVSWNPAKILSEEHGNAVSDTSGERERSRENNMTARMRERESLVLYMSTTGFYFFHHFEIV